MTSWGVAAAERWAVTLLERLGALRRHPGGAPEAGLLVDAVARVPGHPRQCGGRPDTRQAAGVTQSRARVDSSSRRRELPAGGGDVAPAREPDRRRYARLAELRLERGHRVPRRAVVHPRRVVRDQVHLERIAPEERREQPALRRGVVDAGEHHVLDEHPAVRPLGVATAEREHVRQRVAVVDRHQLAPEPRVGGVQREGEPDRLRDLLDEALEAGDPADRRDGRAPMRDADRRGAAARRRARRRRS